MKVIKTNWINVIGVFVATLLYAMYVNITKDNFFRDFWGLIVSQFNGIILYGIPFWVLFIVLLILTDIAFIIHKPTNLKVCLLIQWLIVCMPFFYWFIKYKEWVFLVAVLAFLITQLQREKLIKRSIAE